jgi:type IV secretory pathway VirB4 component
MRLLQFSAMPDGPLRGQGRRRHIIFRFFYLSTVSARNPTQWRKCSARIFLPNDKKIKHPSKFMSQLSSIIISMTTVESRLLRLSKLYQNEMTGLIFIVSRSKSLQVKLSAVTQMQMGLAQPKNLAEKLVNVTMKVLQNR